MKNFIRAIFTVTALCVSLYVFCEEEAYQSEREQRALRMAYELLKVYYPSGELCVSDSIWDEYVWEWFVPDVAEKDRDFFSKLRINKKFVYDEPVYSEYIANLFKSEVYKYEKLKFVADFTRPYRGYFLCGVMPLDRQVGIFGSPTIYVFLFQYDEQGEIIRLNRHEIGYD